MANLPFPGTMADYTANYTKILVSKADGTIGYATPCLARSGGTLTGSLTVSGVVISSTLFKALHATSGNQMAYLGERGGGADAGYFQLNNGATAKVYIDSDGPSVFNGGNVTIGAGNLVVSGTVTAQGSVLTSTRESKHLAGEFEEDALAQITALKLHKFSYKKFETKVLEPEKIDKKGKVLKKAITETVELPAEPTPEHIGVMYDEVIDNPNIATPDGSIKLHNLVFLQAKAIQQLVDRIESLEAKAKK